jgi:ribosomal protein L16 Arg81 hydroxylase
MDFAQFLAPMTAETFVADYFGRRPVQIRGESPRAALLSTARLEELLAVRPHWSEDNLKLILNSRPIIGDLYFEQAPTGGSGRRADPAKIEMFLRMGASLVGDHIEDIDPAVRDAAAMLSAQFAATAGANVYCSFKGIRAFDSHCDLHEVFAVQLEGEKVWQIYENRAEAPIEPFGANAQAMIDQAKGRVLMTVHMQPGDLLYIPRGFFHDALASSDASLHLTFGLAPLNGRYALRLLEEQAIKSASVREYLPDGRTDPVGLRKHLGQLADEMAALIRSPMFEALVRGRQRAIVLKPGSANLRDRAKLDHFAATGQRAEVSWRPAGAVLQHPRGEEPLGLVGEPMEWLLGQQAFSKQQLQAQFGWLADAEVEQLIGIVTRARLFAPFEPQV